MGFPRLDVAHIFFPHAQLLMTGRIRVPLALLPAPFLANLASLSWRGAFLDVPYYVRDLINGESYSYQLRAVNAAGAGAPSQIVEATPVAPLANPAAPTGFSAQAGNAQVTLSWDVATDESITGYEVLQESVGKNCLRGSGIRACWLVWGEWTPIPNSGPQTSSHTVTGLVNGLRYRYQIRAVNLRGKGRASTIVKATPTPPLPAAPTGLSVQAGDAEVTLSWDVANDESITGYEVRQQGKTGSQQSRVWGSWTPIPPYPMLVQRPHPIP